MHLKMHAKFAVCDCIIVYIGLHMIMLYVAEGKFGRSNCCSTLTTMAVSYEAALEAEIKKLNEQRMYASAEMLGSLIVCKASVSFEFLEEYSKALYGM